MISLRPAIVMSDAAYSEWLASIDSEQICLLQEFHPASEMVLDINKEYWQYRYVRVQRDKDGNLLCHDRFDRVPLRQDGLCGYWDSNNSYGKVFRSRIVPLHNDILHPITFKELLDFPSRNKWVETDRPLYEPAWSGDRVFCFSRKSHSPSLSTLLKRFASYTKKVNEGSLVVLFPGKEVPDFEGWWEKNSAEYEGIQYLYSEAVD